jgi:hypothetical protein
MVMHVSARQPLPPIHRRRIRGPLCLSLRPSHALRYTRRACMYQSRTYAHGADEQASCCNAGSFTHKVGAQDHRDVVTDVSFNPLHPQLVSLSLSLCLSLSLSLSVSVSLYLRLSFCLFVSLSLCISLVPDMSYVCVCVAHMRTHTPKATACADGKIRAFADQ